MLLLYKNSYVHIIMIYVNNNLILCQSASRPDKANCNVHETSAFNDVSRYENNLLIQ